jgi:hypothetical protein
MQRKFILFILIWAIVVSAKAQEDSVKIFLGPNDNFLPIEKKKIEINNNFYKSRFYNFSIDIPDAVNNAVNKELPNNCIFSITNNFTDLGFWISHYSSTVYTKAYCERLMKYPEIFRRTYKKQIFDEGPLRGSVFLNDSMKILRISKIPAFQYKCNFIKKTNKEVINGQMIVTQVFYGKFNYRLVCVFENKDLDTEASMLLNNLILKSFTFLETSY